MAATLLDLHTALIAIDLQQGPMAVPFAHPIKGVATATRVEPTARQAYEHEFNVTFAVDALTDSRRVAPGDNMANVFSRLGEIGLMQNIIHLLSVLKEVI